MSVQIAKRCFNVGEYYRMAEAGILTEDDRVELIEGEIVEMSPVGSRHAGCVKRLNALLSQRVAPVAVVSVQDPIRLDDYSEPEPDIALLRLREDFYSREHPTPSDVLLVIEVAETSDYYDREVKVPLYAKAGIAEVWLVALPTNTVRQFAQPVNGLYQFQQDFEQGQTIKSMMLPELSLPIDEILN